MEVDLRELRLAAVGRPLEMTQIEHGMKNKVVTLEVSRYLLHFQSLYSLNFKLIIRVESLLW